MKETMLKPRQRPKNPPRLAMKSMMVILGEVWYSGAGGPQAKGPTVHSGGPEVDVHHSNVLFQGIVEQVSLVKFQLVG